MSTHCFPDKEVKTRKDRYCFGCERKFAAGTAMINSRGINVDQYFYSIHSCKTCAQIMKLHNSNDYMDGYEPGWTNNEKNNDETPEEYLERLRELQKPVRLMPGMRCAVIAIKRPIDLWDIAITTEGKVWYADGRMDLSKHSPRAVKLTEDEVSDYLLKLGYVHANDAEKDTSIDINHLAKYFKTLSESNENLTKSRTKFKNDWFWYITRFKNHNLTIHYDIWYNPDIPSLQTIINRL